MQKNQNGFANLVLIGVLVVLIGIGGYFVFLFNLDSKATFMSKLGAECSKGLNGDAKLITEECGKLMQECRTKYPGNRVCPDGSMVNVSQSAISPSSQTPVDETANWKTYTNNKYGFEVKYPESYSVFDTSGDSRISFRSTEACKSLVSGGGEWPIDCQAYDILVQQNGISIAGGDMSKTFVAGIEAVKFSDSNGMWSNMTQILVQFQKGQNWYIQTFTFNQGKSQIAEGLMNQILSTFKFTEPTVVNTNDIKIARETLSKYFTFLNEKKYIEAVKYYGGDYQVLRDYNPVINANDYTALIKSGCEQNGFRCIKIKNILSGEEISDTEFKFVVQFANNDGTLFKQGPCCGATEDDEPTRTSFEFTVTKFGNNFLVMNLPVYTP